MELRRVDHEGRRTAYRLVGDDADGGAVLAIHGAGGSHRVWSAQMRLASERPVAAIDLSGHGESADIDADPGWETLSAYASDALAVAEAIDARYLLGHSLGAAVLLHLLVRRRVEIAGAVLIGMGPRLPVHEDILRMARTDVEELIAFLHAPGRLFLEPDEDVLGASRAAMRQCDASVICRDFETSHTVDFRADLDAVDTPVLVLCGEADRLTPPHANAALAEGLPRATHATIPGAAHMPMLEQARAVNDRLAAFFADPRES